MAAFLGDVLPHVWNTLTQGADRYHKTVINYIEDADDPVDSDGKNGKQFTTVKKDSDMSIVPWFFLSIGLYMLKILERVLFNYSAFASGRLECISLYTVRYTVARLLSESLSLS